MVSDRGSKRREKTDQRRKGAFSLGGIINYDKEGIPTNFRTIQAVHLVLGNAGIFRTEEMIYAPSFSILASIWCLSGDRELDPNQERIRSQTTQPT
jgi:hypothetical protein